MNEEILASDHDGNEDEIADITEENLEKDGVLIEIDDAEWNEREDMRAVAGGCQKTTGQIILKNFLNLVQIHIVGGIFHHHHLLTVINERISTTPTLPSLTMVSNHCW